MTTTDALDRPARRHLVAGLLLICTLAVVLRAYHALVGVAVSPDGALLIAYAQELADHPLAALRQYDQHPLYPALILLFHGPVGWLGGAGPRGWIVAGQLAAVVGSLGAVLALYWFTVRQCDHRRGLIAAALLAVLPDACRYGADVLTDLPHLALYLVGLAALLTGVHTQRRRYLLLAAAAAALAFLTRPEGASVLVVGLVLVLLHRRWPLKRRAGLAAAMVAVFCCLAGPYQLATGKLIPKKSPLELFNLGFAARVEVPGTASESITHTPPRFPTPPGFSLATDLPVPVNILRQWVRAGRVVYILLAILGLAVARPRGFAARVLGTAVGLHLLLLYALESRYGYLDRRHALILAALSLPLAAEGMWWLACKLRTPARAWRGLTRPRAVVGIIALCALGTSPWLLRPINAGDAHVVAGGRWLARHTAPDALIVADGRLRRVALYADRPFAEWPWWQGGVDHLARFLEDKPAGYFVVDARHITLPERNPAFFEQLEQQLGDRLDLLHTEPPPPHTWPTEIRIYRYRAGRASATPR